MEKTSLRGIAFDLIVDSVKQFIKGYSNKHKFVVGLSGGLDSTVTTWLASLAAGNDNVLGLIMPDNDSTPLVDIEDAQKVVNLLGINSKLIYIDQVLQAYKMKLNPDTKALGNLKARIRMSFLYTFANSENRIVLGTGDKSEIYLGYFTKYGDGGVDILPIGDIYKTELQELASYLGVPKNIIVKKSSPRLWQGQLAENELGVTYDVVDRVLYRLIDKQEDSKVIIKEEGEKARLVIELCNMSEHKRLMPPIAFISKSTNNQAMKKI
ncbi:MAG: NAD+ synthase [Conexivisphaerales archaeon]